jgi:hypothetical protein
MALARSRGSLAATADHRIDSCNRRTGETTTAWCRRSDPFALRVIADYAAEPCRGGGFAGLAHCIADRGRFFEEEPAQVKAAKRMMQMTSAG